MKPTTEKKLVTWLTKYVDDVTTADIKGDKATLKVRGKPVAIVVIQRL